VNALRHRLTKNQQKSRAAQAGCSVASPAQLQNITLQVWQRLVRAVLAHRQGPPAPCARCPHLGCGLGASVFAIFLEKQNEIKIANDEIAFDSVIFTPLYGRTSKDYY